MNHFSGKFILLFLQFTSPLAVFTKNDLSRQEVSLSGNQKFEI